MVGPAATAARGLCVAEMEQVLGLLLLSVSINLLAFGIHTGVPSFQEVCNVPCRRSQAACLL